MPGRLKSSSVKKHLRSAKHAEDKEKKIAKKEKREQGIAIALKAHNEEIHLVGENLPEEHTFSE